MNGNLIRSISVLGLALILAGCKPRAVEELSDSSTALKRVLAIETAQLAGANKQVVLVAPKSAQGPASKLGDEVKAELQEQGLSVEIRTVDLGDPMRYTEYGWKADDFFEVMTRKHSTAGAVVSLIGLPLLLPGNSGNIAPNSPPLLVVATRQIGLAPGVPASPGALEQMLKAKIVRVAIVEGPGTSAGTDKAYKTFDQHYQILR